MSRGHRIIRSGGMALAFILPVLASAPANASRPMYQAGAKLDQCIRQFYDPEMYNWLSFQNGCGIDVYVAFLGQSKRGGGAIELRAGRKDSTGNSRSEVEKYGGFRLAVCPAGYLPVEADGTYWQHPDAQYRCKCDGTDCDRGPRQDQASAEEQERERSQALEAQRNREAEEQRQREAAAQAERAREEEARAQREREEAEAREREQKEADARERERKAAEARAEQERAAEERAERAREAERRRREQNAEAATRRAESYEALAQTRLATGQGDAIGATSMAQLSQLEAISARQGNDQAAQVLRQDVMNQQAIDSTSQAVGVGVAALAMGIFEASERADEAARRREERREKSRQKVEAMLADWRQIDAVGSSLEAEGDFAAFLHSAEARRCRDSGQPWSSTRDALHALERAASSEASDEQRTQAYSATTAARASLQCHAPGFAEYERRMATSCEALLKLDPDELQQEQSAHPDLPQRCMHAAEEAYHARLAASLRGVDAARLPVAGGLRALVVLGAPSPESLKLKPMGVVAPEPFSDGLKPVE